MNGQVAVVMNGPVAVVLNGPVAVVMAVVDPPIADLAPIQPNEGPAEMAEVAQEVGTVPAPISVASVLLAPGVMRVAIAMAHAGRPSRRPTATLPSPPSNPSNSPWPSSCCGGASRPYAKPLRSRTPGPEPSPGQKSHRARFSPWPSSCFQS